MGKLKKQNGAKRRAKHGAKRRAKHGAKRPNHPAPAVPIDFTIWDTDGTLLHGWRNAQEEARLYAQQENAHNRRLKLLERLGLLQPR